MRILTKLHRNNSSKYLDIVLRKNVEDLRRYHLETTPDVVILRTGLY